MDTKWRNSIGTDGADEQTCVPGRTMSRLAQAFALLLSFAGLVLGTTDANAVACATTGVAPNTWSAATTWAAPCNKAGGPVLGDTVTIGAAHTVTVTANAAATSITIAAPSVAAHGININPGITLTVSGAITMAAPAANNRISTFAVGTGTLNAGSIAISGGTGGTRISQVTVGATGIVNVTGAVTAGGTAAQSRFIATGASTITIGGNFGPGAFTPGASTLTVSGNFTPTAMVANTGTVIFSGGAAQSMRALTTYNNVIINKTTGTTATLAGNSTIGGALTVTSGTMATTTRTLTVTGATSVSGTLSSTTGAKTFVGALTINPGGTWTSTTGAVTLRGGLTHNGATFTAGTSVYTFNTTAAQSIACATTLAIPRLTVTAPTVLTNTCPNLTVATALAGTGRLINSATGTLNIGNTSSITTLTNQGTATITGAGAISTALANFTNTGTLNLNGTGTIAGITNSNIVNLTSSGTITAFNNAAGTLNISTTPTVPTITTLTATAAGNTVNYTGLGNQTVKATTYSNLGLSGSGAKAMGATTINGNFTMSGTVTTAPTGALTVGGNFTVGTGTTFTAGAFNHAVSGNFDATGTFTNTGSTVTLNGAAAQTISGTNPVSFNNLTITNAANPNITLATNVTVNGTLSGTVNLTSTCPTDYTLTAGVTVLHGCPPPVVNSINRADANPTTAASVSWTVTLNRSVTGVSSSNFALVNSGLGGTLTITGVTEASGTGSNTVWTVTATTGTGTGTLGLDMTNTAGVTPAVTGLPVSGQIYSVRPPVVTSYYHDTPVIPVNIGFDGMTNVTPGVDQVIPPTITATLITANTCASNARSNSHPAGLYTHSRWYLTTNYAVATNIAANPSGSATLRGAGGAITETVLVSLYDYDPLTGAKVLIGSSATITISGATTPYPYTISSPLYTVPAGHRLMLEFQFNQPATTNRARVYCPSSLTVTESIAPPPHHIQISHDGGALTCTPDTVTITACANALCTAPHYSGIVGVTLTPGGQAFTIDATGVNSAATVQQASAGAATLDATSTASNPATCWNTTTSTWDCAMAFSDSGFVVTVPNHTSCNNATATIEAVQAAPGTGRCVPAYQNVTRAVNLYSSYASPASGTQTITASTGAVSTSAPGTAHSLAFDATGTATITLSYPDAGQLTLTAGDTAPTGASMAGNSTFVVAPASFVFSAIPAAPLTAGQAFNATVTAMNGCATPAVTANFNGTVTLTSSNPQPSIGNATAINADLSGFSNGVASANLTWNEVGTIDLDASLSSYFGWTLPTAATGTQTGVGRFQPAYFDTAVTAGCATFTYAGSTAPAKAGQPFTVTATAKEAGGGITKNYAGATYAYATTLSNAGVTTGLAGNSIAAASFANGVGSANVTYEVAIPETVPLTLAMRATDADPITPVSSSGHTEGAADMRSGRAKLGNAHGSELLGLPIPFRTEYWSSNGWVINNADTCSGDVTLGAGNAVSVALTPPAGWAAGVACVQDTGNPGRSGAGCTAAGPVGQRYKEGATPGIGFIGDFNLWLKAPGSGNTGAVTVTGNVPAWLQYPWGGGAAIDPTARATFGVYKGNNEFIYLREAY
ncbi:MAG: hypothetical protein PXX77_08565 [Gallionella sp.]|nr:hypothetical protein [Gallionella sp.]